MRASQGLERRRSRKKRDMVKKKGNCKAELRTVKEEENRREKDLKEWIKKRTDRGSDESLSRSTREREKRERKKTRRTKKRGNRQTQTERREKERDGHSNPGQRYKRVIMYFGRKSKKKKFQRNYIKKEEKPLNGWCHSFEWEREKIRSSFLYKPIVATSNKLDGVVRGPEQFLCWRATAPALLVS